MGIEDLGMFYGNHQLQYYGNRRLSEYFYGNHQLQKKNMEFELWNKKTSKLWI